MLKILNLEKSYGENTLFADVNLAVDYGERIGLIGRNGHGKSTLLKIITGKEEADHGEVTLSRDYRYGFLEQHLNFPEKTIIDAACADMIMPEDGTDVSYKAKAILLGLGFKEEQFEQGPETLSGGYQIRLNLAKLLVSEPNLLLLDEPTNYLDIISVRWLIRFLQNWPGELVLITHDRDFMDKVTTHTIGIHRNKLRKISGSTSKFHKLIAEEEELTEKTRINQAKKREETEKFINRFRAQASKAKAVQSRVKALEREEVIEKLDDIKSLEFKFPFQLFRGDFLLQIKELAFGYKKDNLLFENLSFSLQPEDRIAIIGKNGKGKTTLLNLIAGEIGGAKEKEKIEFSDKAEFSFFGQTNIDRLSPNLTIEDEITSENTSLTRSIVRRICGQMMFSGNAAEKQIKVLSGGERARVLLGKLLVKPTNILLLDEPTNHLDQESCGALTKALKSYEGSIVFVSHDERLLHKVANKLIIFDRNQVTFFDDNYSEFLKKVGWEDEDDISDKGDSSSGSTLSKQEKKQIRSAVNKERQTVLKPLAREIGKLEKEIMECEEQVKKDTAKMQELYDKDSKSPKIPQLAEVIGDVQADIDCMFDNLEIMTEKHDKLEKEYAEKLNF